MSASVLTDLTALPALVRLHLRRDRVLSAVWFVALVGLVLSLVSGVKAGYPDQAARDAYAAAAAVNPSELALRGPVFAASVGGLLAWSLSSAALVTGVIGILLGVRHTRTDEQSGRSELVGAARVGRLAPTVAAFVAPALVAVLIAAVQLIGLVAQGLPVVGSVIMVAMLAGTGLLFTAVGVLAGQVAGSTGAARTVGFVVLGISYAVAAVGDLTASPAVWFTPLGWSRHAEPYAGDHATVIILPLVLTVVLMIIAAGLARRRDLGAALLPDRPGPRTAAAWLASPLALAWRRQWRQLVGWSVGLGALSALLGSVTSSLDTQLDTPAFRAMAERLGGGGDVGRVFFLFVVYVLAQVATAAAIGTALQLRGDESSGLVEPLLTGPVSRLRWAAAQLVVALAVGAGVLTMIGLAAGATSGDPLGLLLICWSYLPTVLIMVGIATVLTGWLPRAAVGVTWTVLALLLLVDLLSELGLISPQLTGLSPYAATFTALMGQQSLPLVLGSLLGLGIVLVALGLLGLRRRDLVLG